VSLDREMLKAVSAKMAGIRRPNEGRSLAAQFQTGERGVCGLMPIGEQLWLSFG